MSSSNKANLNFLYAISIAALIFLIVITAVNPNPPLFDEIFYFKNMALFEKHGLSKKFLLEIYEQAPGPLYQIVHTVLKPVTNLKVPGIRLVNVVFFLLVIVNLFYILRWVGYKAEPRLILSLNLVAVPVVWQTAGMALSEMPAMFFATFSMVLICRTFSLKDKKLFSAGLGLLAGISLGLSILGRSPFLLIIPASVILIFNPFGKEKISVPPMVYVFFIVGAILTCFPVFFVWKGMVPPHVATKVAKGALKPWHGILAFAYTSIITLIVNPKWLRINRKTIFWLTGAYIVLLTANYFWLHLKYHPLTIFLSKILPEVVMSIYPHLISPVLMLFAGLFMVRLGQKLWEERNNRFYLFIGISLALILISCINIKHLFSSRYVAQAAPFIVLIISENDSPTKGKIVRTLIGISIGYISLSTYVNP